MTAAVKDLQADITKVCDHIEVAEDIETRIALSKLEEILRSWRASLQAKGK